MDDLPNCLLIRSKYQVKMQCFIICYLYKTHLNDAVAKDGTNLVLILARHIEDTLQVRWLVPLITVAKCVKWFEVFVMRYFRYLLLIHHLSDAALRIPPAVTLLCPTLRPKRSFIFCPLSTVHCIRTWLNKTRIVKEESKKNFKKIEENVCNY